VLVLVVVVVVVVEVVVVVKETDQNFVKLLRAEQRSQSIVILELQRNNSLRARITLCCRHPRRRFHPRSHVYLHDRHTLVLRLGRGRGKRS
jgi:hypothetical protein